MELVSSLVRDHYRSPVPVQNFSELLDLLDSW
jgi:hypothetical protein